MFADFAILLYQQKLFHKKINCESLIWRSTRTDNHTQAIIACLRYLLFFKEKNMILLNPEGPLLSDCMHVPAATISYAKRKDLVI